MTGSSRVGEIVPPREKKAHEKRLDRMEDLLGEMLCVRTRCTTNATAEVKLGIKEHHYQCMSAIAHRYRELIPRVRITFDQCRALKMGVTMLIEGLNFYLNESSSWTASPGSKKGDMTTATQELSGSISITRRRKIITVKEDQERCRAETSVSRLFMNGSRSCSRRILMDRWTRVTAMEP